MIDETLAALAGLGLFLAGLHMLSDVTRTLAGKRVRALMTRTARIPMANALAGSLLGTLTQSTSAAAFICIGLLGSRAISFPAALTITSWSGVGTGFLVFLASIDLRLVALAALSFAALFYISSFYRSEAGHKLTELVLAAGVTLLGLTMLKQTGDMMGASMWVREFFTFAGESWVYGFIIGFVVTLVMQSSSTVTIIAVTLSAAGLLTLRDAVVLVCGSNIGSGVSVALASSYLTGPPRQLAMWQTLVKLLGSIIILPLALAAFDYTPLTARISDAIPVPQFLAVTYLVLNILGAVLSGLFRQPLLSLLSRLAPGDTLHRQYEPEFIVDEAADDAGTAFLLAEREQAKLMSLLPEALSPLRPEEIGSGAPFSNAERRQLAMSLADDISDFLSEAVRQNSGGADVNALLRLQRANSQIVSLIDALHDYVQELSPLLAAHGKEDSMANAMTESLHLLLSLAAEQARGDETQHETLQRMTKGRSEVMTRFRGEILQHGGDAAARETLYIATGLFERAAWLIRRLSADISDITGEIDPSGTKAA